MKKRLLYLIYSLLLFVPMVSLAQLANHVVISEMYGGGGNSGSVYTNDFIELYNPTNSPVDISGWSVQYASATGTAFSASATTITIIPAGTSIKAHGYFLIQEAAGAATPAALPTPDLIGTITIGAAAGKIALVSNSTPLATAAPSGPGIVDFLGFGTANTSEGSSPSPAPSNSTSVERKASASSTASSMAAGGTEDLQGNGWDSDNNGNDFIVPTVVNPQNSSSPTEPVLSVTPVLTVTPLTLTFSNQNTNTSSTAQTFSLSATNVPATGVTVTAAAPFAVSKDGVTYSGSVTYTAADLATSKNISVQFTPTAAGPASGNITIAAAGATSQSVAVTGTGVVAAGSLTASATSLTFGSQAANTTSAAQTFTLTGTGLVTNTTVSTNLPFSLSKDGVTYSTLLTFTPAELATAKSISVQFGPAVAGAASGNITIASSGIANKTVALTGTATAAAGGSATNHVVISQIYGSGGNAGALFNYDFIELYNPTSGDIDISNWSVQYQSAATFGAFSGQTAIPAGTIIKAHGYYLIQEQPNSQTTVVGALLPTPDLVTTGTINNFNMSGASGKVALVNNTTVLSGGPPSTTNIVDFIGYGAVNYSEGYVLASPTNQATTSTTAGSAPTLSATTSLLRLANATATAASMAAGGADANAGNGYDSNVNATDFVLEAGANIVPHSSSTPAQPAITPILTVTPTALDFGTTQQVTTTSAAKTFTVSGVNVPSTGVTLSVAATDPFTISSSATGVFGKTLTLTQAQLATPQTIYVVFTPTAVAAATGSVGITATGAVSQGVILTGTGSVLIIPSLAATPSGLAFGNVNAGTSPVLTYILSGANLGTNNTTVTATAPYTISKNGSTYSASLSFTPAEIAASPTISVKFTPTAGGAANSTITTVNAVVATPPVVTLTANTVVNQAPTVDAIADQAPCGNGVQTIPLTGISAGSSSESAQTLTISVKSSNSALFSQIGVLPINGTTSAINYAITNGKSGTAVVTITLKDNGGIVGGGVDSLVRTFNVNVSPAAVVTITSDAPNNTVEKGNTLQLTATGGTTYAWTSSASTNDIVGPANVASISVRPATTGTITYTVTATNTTGCTTVQTIKINVINATKLITGNIITPNGDGINDTWVIRNIELYPANTVRVFDKSGKIVFSTTGYTNNWNGYYNGQPLNQGTYYYVVDLGTGNPYKGYISVVRD